MTILCISCGGVVMQTESGAMCISCGQLELPFDQTIIDVDIQDKLEEQDEKTE